MPQISSQLAHETFLVLLTQILWKHSCKNSPSLKLGENPAQFFRIWYQSRSAAYFVSEKWISWKLSRGARLFGGLASWRADFTICVHLAFSKDGESLRKFLYFDTKVNILSENETGKALVLFNIYCCKLWIYKIMLLLPTAMALSHLNTWIAQQDTLVFLAILFMLMFLCATSHLSHHRFYLFVEA